MRRLSSPRAWATATVTAVAHCLAAPVRSEAPNDQQALTGLSEVKVAFDLTSGDPKQLLTQSLFEWACVADAYLIPQ